MRTGVAQAKDAAGLPEQMVFRDFVRLSVAELETLIHLYDRTFGAPWEMPVEQIRALAGHGGGIKGIAGLALLVDGQPAGLAVHQYLPGANLMFLRYMAVVPSSRGRGLGGFLLREVGRLAERAASAHDHDGCLGLLLEVETPSGLPAGADLELRLRRIRFYERHGALRLGLTLPRPLPGYAGMPEWELMLLPGSIWERAPKPPNQCGLVEALYYEGYGLSRSTAWVANYLAQFCPE